MRYIDEMLRGIPVEDLLGEGTAEKINEIGTVQDDLAIIPDVPAINVRRAANGRHRTADSLGETGPEASDITGDLVKASREKKAGGKHAPGVKRSGMGILAAVLALVIGMGGVMAYFGAVKHTGPLAEVFTSETSSGDRETADFVPESKTDTTAEDKDDANKYAKLLYTVADAYCAERTADGLSVSELSNCVYEIKICENEQIAIMRSGYIEQSGTPSEYLEQMSLGKHFPVGSEICMFFGEKSIIKAQYRASENGYVGQYPDPADGIDFGLGSTFTVDEREPTVKMKYEVSIADFKTAQKKVNKETETVSLSEMRELQAAERTEVTDPGPKIYGETVSISLYYRGDLFRFRSSDAVNADVIIDDKYYIAPKLKRYLDSRKVVVSSTIVENGLTKVVNTDEEDEALWYGRFLKENLASVSDPGRQIDTNRMYRAVIKTYDGYIEVLNTNYENANIQVNGKLYQAKDTSIFDMMDAAAAGIQFHPEDKVSVKYVGTYRESSENIEILPKPDIGIGYNEIMNAEKTEVTSFKSEQSVGIMYVVTLYDNSTGKSVNLRSSDHSEADAIIGGKYYKCEKAKELLKAISVNPYIQFRYNTKYAYETSDRLETDRLEQWYRDFKAKGYKPRVYLGDIQAFDLFIVLFNTEDGPVSISTTSYVNANIVIGNEYYFLSPEELDEFKSLVIDVYEWNG